MTPEEFDRMYSKPNWPDPSHFSNQRTSKDEKDNGCAAVMLLFMLFMAFGLGVLVTIVSYKVW